MFDMLTKGSEFILGSFRTIIDDFISGLLVSNGLCLGKQYIR